MEDPLEGVDAQGHVVTGVAAEHIPAAHRPLITVCTTALADALGEDLHSVRLYGSVATGRAVAGRSDLDLLAILRRPTDQDLTAVAAAAVGHRSLVRDVGVGRITLEELTAPTQAARVERCFLHHCTVVVHGPALALADVPCQADTALARGFSAGLLRRLPAVAAGDLDAVEDVAALGRGLLMAAALLLSTRNGGWSTDRRRAVDLLADHAPQVAADAQAVFDWADSRGGDFGAVPEDHARALIRLAAWLEVAWRGQEQEPGAPI